MTTLFLRCLLLARRIALLGLLCVLAACGPGGGGTGTGPTLSFTSATSGSTAGGPVPSPAGAPVAACGRLDLQLEESRVELVTACGSFVFEGGWAADPSYQVVLQGVLENSATGSAIPVTLLLQFSGTPATSQSVIVTVTSEAGQTLVGPEVLGRVENLLRGL